MPKIYRKLTPEMVSKYSERPDYQHDILQIRGFDAPLYPESLMDLEDIDESFKLKITY